MKRAGDVCTANESIWKYVRSGKMQEAMEVCYGMDARDVYAWTMLLSGYLKQGNPKETLNQFQRMLEDGVEPNIVTFVCVLKASTLCVSRNMGKIIHVNIVEKGIDRDIFVGSTLIDMYAKFGSLENAEYVFLKLPKHNTVSWTSMMAGYTRHGLPYVALKLFSKMHSVLLAPNEVTFATALTASSLIALLEEGHLIHDMVVACGYESNCFVGNSIIDMYLRCGCTDCADHAFKRMARRDLVSWNVMISGYVLHGMCKQAMILFYEMVEEKTKPDKTTFLSALKACSESQGIREGEWLYRYIQSSGVELDVVLGSSLMNMFVKCGCMENARLVFEALPKRDVITWTILISGFISHGHPNEALKLFKFMKQHKVLPDRLSLVSVLNACTSLGDLDMGEKIHDDIVCAGLECDVCLGSCLVDMYAKCGSLSKALRVFGALPKKDVIAYNALVIGCAQHGDHETLNDILKQMLETEMKLDSVSYLSMFLAFSHCGLLDEGCRLVMFLTQECDDELRSEHFSCIIDLLSRGGLLKDAEGFLESMPFQPSSGDWTALLSACKTYSDIEMAQFVVEMVQELDPCNVGVAVH